MNQDIFTHDDLGQMRQHGLSSEEVQRQLDLFQKPPFYLHLLRPCTPGDGIKVIDKEEVHLLPAKYEHESPKRACLKFVPASGAASRMFKTLLWFLNEEKEIRRDTVTRRAQSGQTRARELLEFINGLKRFAFFKDLKSIMKKKGLDIAYLIKQGEFTDILTFLLTGEGLGYASLPKGLLKFHEYADGNRTAFEEHLAEAASCVCSQSRQCFLHFTVSQEHMAQFDSLLRKVKTLYEDKYHVSFHVDFSVQKRSTDTIAVSLDNTPFRRRDGSLLFRPGGHGALIENLRDLRGDILFIKNIDNVAHERLKSETSKWKKILGGYLITIQGQIFDFMEKLSAGATDGEVISQVTAFMRDALTLPLPVSILASSGDEKRRYLMERLNRPIRVCGMVENKGEPGGGPFWVRDMDGETSMQIVEKAQVDPDSNEQQQILGASTHFSPVDLVCGVRDWQGIPFDLRGFSDPKSVLISKKSKDGKDLKALEHPGLWNGSMARWITQFVEVPLSTFNPVKTVNDLLRKEHQPE